MVTKKSLQEKFSAWYIPLICKHQFKALAFYLLLAALCAFPIFVKPGLRLDADLSHLLPDETPSVLALQESYQRFGSTDRFTIAIQSEKMKTISSSRTTLFSISRCPTWNVSAITWKICNWKSAERMVLLLWTCWEKQLPLHLKRRSACGLMKTCRSNLAFQMKP